MTSLALEPPLFRWVRQCPLLPKLSHKQRTRQLPQMSPLRRMSPPTINAPAGAVAQAENATATASTGPLDILALLQGNTVDNDNAAHPAPACTVHVGTARWGQNPKLAFDAIVAKMQHRSAVGPTHRSSMQQPGIPLRQVQNPCRRPRLC